jgi:hypothetical protein
LLRFGSRAICLQFGQMFFRPFAQSVQRLDQSATQSRERIFNFWRNDWVNDTVNQSVTLKAAQGLGQHLLGNAANGALEFGVTHRSVRKDLNDERSPFIRDAIKHEAGRALRIHDRGGRFCHALVVEEFAVARKERVTVNTMCMDMLDM